MKGVALVLVAVLAVAVGVVMGMFVPQVNRMYVTETEVSTFHTTEVRSHTFHTTESLFTTRTDTRTETIAETEILTYVERTTKTEIVTVTTLVRTPPAGYEVFSKYGFSFEYPRGMTLSERGLLQSTATDYSGMVVGELTNGEFEMLFAGWIESVTVPDLEAGLEAAFGRLEETEGVEMGELVETTKAGHRMIRQHFNATFLGIVIHCIWGVWYCNTSQTLYELGLMYSEEDTLAKYQTYLDSFVCHG